MPVPKKADWTDTFKKKQVGVSDMTLLSKVDDNAINDNLEKRFYNGDIYTYIGHVLISVNPFKDLGLYTDEILQSYVGKNRIEMPPHVFSIAESAYYNMKSYKENQCVIISGESGAGKTEAAKKIMHYIANVSGGQSASIQEIKEMVLATNPLLESFGCAKTLRNNNSSRHGKYLEIQFNAQGETVGAFITNYLLEKNRVISQIKNERNFHIFYQFCLGASQEYKDLFGISGPESYLYTSQSGCLKVDGMDDVKEYQDTLKAMQVIGLTADEQSSIHRVLATILWLGNTQFTESDNNSSYVTDADVIDFVAYLLEVDVGKLEKTLVTRVMETKRGGRRGSVYEVPLNTVQASVIRDALAKALYDRLFEWIIERINRALQQRGDYQTIIGVLDIYGFEIFEHNSFEQLCINYVNEKLQQIFIELTLKSEQEEYVREKIEWTPIKFFNNKIVCDLIEEKRPPGIFAAMNDACATAHADPTAADSSFVQKLGMCASNPHLEQRGHAFIVKHYAGDVTYSIQGMTDKNKDQLSKDILELIHSSEGQFVRGLFPDQIDQDSKRRPPTASDRIKTSAGALVNNLMQAQPSYIRCIKPNSNKSPKEYDQKMSLHQVKYLGLCENVRVRRAGFAYRQTFEKFVERFFLLSKKTSYAGEYIWRGDARTGTETILKDINIPKEEWQLGTSKAFIRHPETLWSLESLRDKYWHTMASRIQRAFRAYLQFKHDCATKIQRCFKKNKDQIKFVQYREHGHQLLAGRKERRRFSLLSMRKYVGDYLGVNLPKQGEALRNICGIQVNSVVYSSKIQLLVPRPLRSSKPSSRIFILTRDAIYIIATTVEKKLVQMKLERKLTLNQIMKASTSNLMDDWLVLHVRDDIDIVMSTFFKTELCVHLSLITNQRITLEVAASIEYSKKSNKNGTIKFMKDENVKEYDVYKNHVVSICSGESANSVSRPPCKRLEPVRSTPKKTTKAYVRPKTSKPKPVAQNDNYTNSSSSSIPAPPPSLPPVAPSASKVMYKALYDFEATNEGSLSFRAGDMFDITQKDENGWWLGSFNGQEGWVPSNYFEEIKPAPLPERKVPPPPPVVPQVEQPKPVVQQEIASPMVQVHQAIKAHPKPKPKPIVQMEKSNSDTEDNIPAWKRELNAIQHSKSSGNVSPDERPPIAQRPTSKVAPSIPAKPHIPARPSIPAKPSTISQAHSRDNSDKPNFSKLAATLNGRIPTQPRPNSAYVQEQQPPSLPVRPGANSNGAGAGKMKPPPRPPIPPRN